jgi:hypothetical protein
MKRMICTLAGPALAMMITPDLRRRAMWTQMGSAKKRWLPFILILPVLVLLIGNATAQATAFTYQGKLVDNGSPANGQYDFEFKLFDTTAVGTGAQQGTTVALANVTVSNGLFTVQLDFGSVVFTGANRFLEIAVMPTSGSTFTTLSPRQAVAANPYAIRSLNSTTADGLSVACVNCITGSQIQSVQGAQVTGDIAGNQINGAIPVASVPAGSGNYIHNNTSQQAATNFNISGNGAANILEATTQFNLGGNRILSNAGTENIFAGVGAGAANTSGPRNAFFGRNAGNANTNGNDNAFFGFNAGLKSRSFANSFFGSGAGAENVNGNSLAFFGNAAGNKNVTGVNNSFFGNAAGRENIAGSFNTFLGFAAGLNNTTGDNNIFIGHLTGNPNTATQVSNSIAIGNGVSVSTSDTIILGKAGQNTQIPGKLLMGGGVPMGGNFVAQSFSNLGFFGIFTGNLVLDENALNNVLPSQVHLCIRTTNIGNGLGGEMLTRCTAPFSSLANKTDVQPFTGGLEIIKRLKPVSFKWKADGRADVGLNAEDVAEVAPQIVTRNAKGEVEDLKHDNLSALFINAFKEQQAQIKQQQQEIEMLKKRQQEFEALKALLCADHPAALVCKSK